MIKVAVTGAAGRMGSGIIRRITQQDDMEETQYLWETMKKKGFSTYKLRENCGIDSKTVRRLKANENIETKTIDKICTALDCNIEDIMEYKK